MRIAVSGAGGVVGTAVSELLKAGGHEVIPLVRREICDPVCEISWLPGEGRIDGQRLEGLDAVVHLAGESLSSGRWTAAKKKEIRTSRVDATRLLSRTLAGLERPPGVLVSASAVGYYGNRGDELLTEDSVPGSGFVSDLCVEWENAALEAEASGIRVVTARIGIALSMRGGALLKMVPIFRRGLGGAVGSGKQYMSWVSIGDVAGAIWHSINKESISGPVNITAPWPVTNGEFTSVLSRVVRRRPLGRLPAAAARAVWGEMADEILLAGARVLPRRLMDSGFFFRFPELEGALRHLLLE